MAGMFRKFVYTNLWPTHEEVQRLDFSMIGGVELNDDESAFSHDTYSDCSEEDNAKVDEYLSTIPESSQVEIDAIMQRLAAPVDDTSLEVVKLVDEIVNLHSLSDSQIPSDYPNSVVVAHLAAKIPTKRIRTRSRVFKSSYMTDYASGSKALEDENTDLKKKFAFEGYEIFDDMPSSSIEEYKK
ncbi:hypothetical protein FXO38_14497 [Capsicum annuum]|nr:hypothetical protein FXO38_14497 [Capsicum annuum]